MEGNMMGKGRKPAELVALERLLGSGLVWVAAAVFLLIVVAVSTIRFGRVTGEEVGIQLDRMNGKITVISQSGVKLYNGLLSDFYVLDRTLQTLDMSQDTTRGDRMRKDDLKIKTVDGSDVYVDLKIQYKIAPEMAEDVILTSGPGDLYKQKWARDYMRSMCRNYLGELTTEEFYDSSKRDARLVLAKQEANEKLRTFGIVIDSIVIPKRPQFYKEYEQMIKKKKLADQGVLEEQSKAMAAKQKQLTLIVQETNAKNVAVEQFEGQMRQKVIQSEAEAERSRKEADAYFEEHTVAAGATLYRMKKGATAILARKTAEADGIMALRKALEGEGGRNMVKLEYARKLKNITIVGKPFTIQSNIERFEHLKGPASTGRE
ncbi:MAG: hypothetical protein HQ559_15925 [Lentisphaerae bacterium]|nr:hypothetical protein [Lentisphaerota bacterium]